MLSKIGADDYRALIKIKRADNRGKAQPHAIDEKLRRMADFLAEILENHECYDLRGLAVNGDDLKAVGITDGKAIRDALNGLLGLVITEHCKNEKDALLKCVYAAAHAGNS